VVFFALGKLLIRRGKGTVVGGKEKDFYRTIYNEKKEGNSR